MLNYIIGKVVEVKSSRIISECQNCGYEVYVLGRDIYNQNSIQKVYIYDYLNTENISTLVGFNNLLDLEIFKKLIKIPTIGTKTAIQVLNLIDSQELIALINNDDLFTLKEILGNKANNVYIGLKKGVEKLDYDIFKYENVYLALKKLGYRQDIIKKALSKLDSNTTYTDEQALKEALKVISYAK